MMRAPLFALFLAAGVYMPAHVVFSAQPAQAEEEMEDTYTDDETYTDDAEHGHAGMDDHGSHDGMEDEIAPSYEEDDSEDMHESDDEDGR